jgi:hypothetical protein
MPPVLPLLADVRPLIPFVDWLVSQRPTDTSYQLLNKYIVKRLAGTLEPIYVYLEL